MSDLLPSVEELDAELHRRSLSDFVRAYWSVVEPATPLVWGWHLDAICDHLQAVSEGHITRLLINVPPGHMKSLIVSVFWPAWEWTRMPGRRSLFSSYAMALAVRDSVKCRRVIESDPYRAFGVTLREDSNAKDSFANTFGGVRHTTSVGSSVIGWRGDAVVVDDPIDTMSARSEHARHEVVEWWDKAMSSRLNDQRTGARVIIMQRLHEDDLSGHVLRQGGYEHLVLPTEFDPANRAATCGGAWTDPRTERGELLFPAMFPREVVARIKLDLGSDGFAGQHQQTPVNVSGGMFARDWWKRFTVPPPSGAEWAASIDCTFKDSAKSDYVVAQVWARHGARHFLVWQSRRRMSFTETCELVKRLKSIFPRVGPILIEDKANGPAVLDALRATVPGLIAIDPGARGKEARAAAVTPFVEAGNVYLPAGPLEHPWESDEPGDPVEQFIHELSTFPRGRNDDQFDACTQMLNRWRAGGVSTARVMPIPTRPTRVGVDM